MLAHVLVLALGADSPDAGVPAFTGSLYASCPDAPPVIILDGGVAGEAFAGWRLMSPERSARVACLMLTCETNRKLAEQTQTAPPWWWVVTASLAVGFAGLGVLVGRMLP